MKDIYIYILTITGPEHVMCRWISETLYNMLLIDWALGFASGVGMGPGPRCLGRYY
jgi:hypothetical protein